MDFICQLLQDSCNYVLVMLLESKDLDTISGSFHDQPEMAGQKNVALESQRMVNRLTLHNGIQAK